MYYKFYLSFISGLFFGSFWCHHYSISATTIRILDSGYNQELMSGEAAKERVTTAYTRVPSKSKSLAS